MFNKISDAEKQMICYSINHYAGGHSTVITDDLPAILGSWNHSKRTLFELFGQELILSKKVEFVKSLDQMREEWYSCNSDIVSGVRDARQALNKALYKEFIEHPAPSVYISNPSEFENFIYSTDATITNKYEGRGFVLAIGDKKGITVNDGCKFARELGKICEYTEDAHLMELCENFRLAQSLFLNQKKLVGALHISIHPLDFITMSDNESGWESCMSWRHEGCYRAGTVEMMNSPYVVVAYLDSSNTMTIGQHSWNNKKWRSLFVVDPASGVISSVKNYPYYNEYLNSEVVNWIKGLTGEEWTENYLYNDNDLYDGKFVINRAIKLDFETAQMYNDFGCTTHTVAFSKSFIDNGLEHFYCDYSGDTTCVCCGEIKDTDDESCLICEECGGEILYCSVCGNKIHRGDECYGPHGDDNMYCQDCFAEYFVWDPLICEYVDKDDAAKIYIVSDEMRDILLDKAKNNANEVKDIVRGAYLIRSDFAGYSTHLMERYFEFPIDKFDDYAIGNSTYVLGYSDFTDYAWRYNLSRWELEGGMDNIKAKNLLF